MHKELQNSKPPQAAQKPHWLEKHGHRRLDPYFWLRERENREVLEYLRAENKYVEGALENTEKLQDELFLEMKSRVMENEASVPVKRGEFLYWYFFEKGKEYPVFARKKVDDVKNEILIDGNSLAQGHSFFKSTPPMMSPNQELMAYGTDTQGRRFFEVRFKDLKKNRELSTKLEKVTGNLAWASDNTHVFYTQQNPETLRSDTVYRLNVFTGEKEKIYFEEDETFSVHVSQSLAKNYLFIFINSTLTTEVRVHKNTDAKSPWKVFLPRERGHEYQVEDGGDRFFVLSNWNAKNFRFFEASYEKTDKAHWREVIPHKSDVLLVDATVFENHFVLKKKSEGLDRLVVYNRKGLSSFEIPVADAAYSLNPQGNVEFKSNVFRYDFESPRKPETTFDYNMLTKEQKHLRTKAVPNFDSENYRTERIWIAARDNTKVPVTLLMKKAYAKNQGNPLFVYGYGSYGYSMDPYFSSQVLSLVDRGFVYAVAHVRGGSELGRAWYEDGRTLEKKNTFYDFIDATEALVKEGYGDPRRVYAAGGSAGGLLMGAIINMRPELYAGVVASVPFVDVITTMLDESIPLTTGEYDEWGNPNEKKYYDYILSYSPYDNVKDGKYPNLLVTTGLHDSQVQYWEPAKWVAKLRDHNRGQNQIFLKTNMDAGHGGASGRYESIKETALEWAFMLWVDEKQKNSGARP